MNNIFSYIVKSYDFTIHRKILFMYCLYTIHESYNIIHIFKNYFIIIFLIFNFSNNKFNSYRLFKLDKGDGDFKSSFG